MLVLPDNKNNPELVYFAHSDDPTLAPKTTSQPGEVNPGATSIIGPAIVQRRTGGMAEEPKRASRKCGTNRTVLSFQSLSTTFCSHNVELLKTSTLPDIDPKSAHGPTQPHLNLTACATRRRFCKLSQLLTPHSCVPSTSRIPLPVTHLQRKLPGH
jgi:hypothetical protein